MSIKMWQTFVIFALLFSSTISGGNKIMVCKNIESVFTEVKGEPSDGNISRLQGPPGKIGPSGNRGLPGLPGIQGIPGIPATVDYDRISQMIEEKVRQEMEEANEKVKTLQNNVTLLLQGQRCKEENGLSYNGNCYIVPDIQSSELIKYNQAVQKCSALDAVVAEVHSIAHQQAIQDLFQLRIPSSRSFNNLAVAMIYQSSSRNLRFRSGKEISIDQFKWHDGYPVGSATRVGVQISDHSRPDTRKWLFNWATTGDFHGVICEKSL